MEHFISGHQVYGSLWEMWKFVSTSSKSLWQQLGVLQFSSILTLSTWGSFRSHRLRAHSKTTPLPPPPFTWKPFFFRHQLQMQKLRLSPELDLLPIELSSALTNLLGGSQNSGICLHLPVYKEYDNPDKEGPEFLSSRSSGASPYWCGCVPSLEGLWYPYYWDVIEASSSGHDQLLTPICVPCHSLEEAVEPKIPSFLTVAGSLWWPAL